MCTATHLFPCPERGWQPILRDPCRLQVQALPQRIVRGGLQLALAFSNMCKLQRNGNGDRWYKAIPPEMWVTSSFPSCFFVLFVLEQPLAALGRSTGSVPRTAQPFRIQQTPRFLPELAGNCLYNDTQPSRNIYAVEPFYFFFFPMLSV